MEITYDEKNKSFPEQVPGTEDMVAAYYDYRFHIKGGFIGMLMAIPAALVAGAIVVL